MAATTTKPRRNGAATTTHEAATAVTDAAELHPSVEAQINIQRLGTETLIIPITGKAPLIVSRFSEKAKRQMLDAQQGKKRFKTNRDPQAEFEASLYRIAPAKPGGPPRYGFPAIGFKACTVGAARFFSKDVTMTSLRQFLFFEGVITPDDEQALIEIIGTPVRREDVVRLAGASRTADLRFRAMFYPWSAELRVRYFPNCISRESVVSLVDAGGMGVGVGEWRPERKGDMGTFEVDEGSITSITR